jgi:hypothetical protein
MILPLLATTMAAPPQALSTYRPPPLAQVAVEVDEGLVAYSVQPVEPNGTFRVEALTFTLHRTGEPNVVWSETPDVAVGAIETAFTLLPDAPRHLIGDDHPVYLHVEASVVANGRRDRARWTQIVAGTEPEGVRGEANGWRFEAKRGHWTTEELTALDAGVEVDHADQ